LKKFYQISGLQLIVLIFCFLIQANSMLSQVTSKIEEVNGVAYYMHEVAKGQTLYSLSKLYGCDVNDITASNPGTEQGINLGSVIKIPASKVKLKGFSMSNDSGRNFLMHEVLKKETLYSIANKYNIDINDLVAANPGSDQGVKKGQILKVPIKKEAPKEIPSDKHAHTVKAGETLFGIAKQYSVSVDDLKNANSGLPQGLLAGEIILIPTNIGPETNSNSPGETRIKDVKINGDVFQDNYDIGLMLPFYLNYNDTMEAKENKMREVALQLYRGAMMAADSLKKDGLKAKLHVYDVIDSKSMITDLLAKDEMKEMDVIIGPLYREILTDVCVWGAANGTHVVSPVQQPNKVLFNSPNMSKTVPATATQWVSVARHLFKKHGKDNIVVIDSKNIDDRRSVDAFREEWKKLSGDSLRNIVVVGDAASFNVKDKFIAGKKNIVVAPTSDKKVIGTLFKNLGEGDITVYGNENWDDLDAISVSNRNKYKVHFPSTTFINYDDPGLQRWVEAYRKLYKSEPGKFSLIGYDVMKFYGAGLLQFGRSFPNHLNEISTRLYANGFDFFKTSNESGFENQYVMIIGTDNYELSIEN
jgi:LysM repeat protein